MLRKLLMSLALLAATYSQGSFGAQLCSFCSNTLFYGCYQGSSDPTYLGTTAEEVLGKAYARAQALASASSSFCGMSPPNLAPNPGGVGSPPGAFTRYYRISYTYTFGTRPNRCDETYTTTVNEPNTAITCENTPQLVGFFNGVWNTQREAGLGLEALGKLTGAEFQFSTLKHELFYNHTGCGGERTGVTCLEDVAEVFAQRQGEFEAVLGKRWEIFWDILGGRHRAGGSLTGVMLGKLGGSTTSFGSFLEGLFQQTVAQIVRGWAGSASNPPTYSDMADHNQKLEEHLRQGYRVVVIAHSQGNLFMNSAVDTFRAKYPNRTLLQAVHIGPASPSVRGEYVIGDIDLIINGLRAVGGVPAANLSVSFSFDDITGHTLVETYLDPARQARPRVKEMVFAAMARATPF